MPVFVGLGILGAMLIMYLNRSSSSKPNSWFEEEAAREYEKEQQRLRTKGK